MGPFFVWLSKILHLHGTSSQPRFAGHQGEVYDGSFSAVARWEGILVLDSQSYLVWVVGSGGGGKRSLELAWGFQEREMIYHIPKNPDPPVE